MPTPLQPPWSPCCSSNTPATPLPQGLCTHPTPCSGRCPQTRLQRTANVPMSLWGEEHPHSHDTSSLLSIPFLRISLTTFSHSKCDYVCSFISFGGCVVSCKGSSWSLGFPSVLFTVPVPGSERRLAGGEHFRHCCWINEGWRRGGSGEKGRKEGRVGSSK